MIFSEDKEWSWSKVDLKEDSVSFSFDIRGIEYNDKARAMSKNEIDVEDIDNVEDVDEDEEEEQSEPMVRRSTRVSTEPTYLDDYVLLVEAECERLLMIINNELWDYNEAKEMKVWFDACKEEICSIEKNKTWILGFQRCSKEPSHNTRDDKAGLLLVCVYVDDLLVTGSKPQSIVSFKRETASKFEMSGLGRLTYYLGIEVHQHEGGITLVHDRYVRKILEETGMNACNLTHSPMDMNVVL